MGSESTIQFYGLHCLYKPAIAKDKLFILTYFLCIRKKEQSQTLKMAKNRFCLEIRMLCPTSGKHEFPPLRVMHISTACPGGTPPGHPRTLKKHDSNALIPPPSPGKCVSQTALPLGLRIK
jgi:hypothetical protein